MTPAARAQAAIEIVDDWRAGPEGLDRLLTRWGRNHRFAGSGDRHAIADLVYGAVRRLRSAAWIAGAGDSATTRDILRGYLLMQGTDPATVFTGARHAPALLAPDEARAARVLDDAPRPVRLDYPDWLAPDLAALPDAMLGALRERAALDLRVNTLKADIATALRKLAQDGIAAEPGPLSPSALRVTAGHRKVQRSGAYRDGLVEIQDAASQAVADLAAAQPGETVLDLCAGGGGKTLAFAAAMRHRGRLIAHDISAARIAALAPRAARAGAAVTMLAPGALEEFRGTCDLVMVDAPCSGSGAWRRNPDAKWRLTPEDLRRLTRTQSDLLAEAADLARPTGRVVYATCSLIERENRAIVDDFLRRNDDWMLVRSRGLTPLDDADGFFTAVLQRRKNPV